MAKPTPGQRDLLEIYDLVFHSGAGNYLESMQILVSDSLSVGVWFLDLAPFSVCFRVPTVWSWARFVFCVNAHW